MKQVQKFLLLGGKPIASMEIARYVKSKGIYLIVADYLPISASPAKQIADECWNISTASVDELEEAARRSGVTAVFTGVHEFNITQALELSQRLGLPFYTTPAQWEFFTDKTCQKKLFRQFGVSVPEEYFVGNVLPMNLPDKVEYPVLLKPVDGSGAFGVLVCRDKQQLLNNFPVSLAASPSGRVLVERYIEGTEATIFYIIQNGKVRLSAMADRHVKHNQYGIIPLPVAYVFPSRHLEHYLEATNDKVIAALESCGIQNGMLFIQTLVKDGNFLFYDVGYRLTGTQEYLLLEEICGFNPLKMLVDYALTGEAGESILDRVNPRFNCFAGNLTFLARPATIGSFVGLEELASMEGVVAVLKNHFEGETIPESVKGTLNQVVLRVFFVAPTRERMKDIMDYAHKVVRVLSPAGENILLPHFDTAELEE